MAQALWNSMRLSPNADGSQDGGGSNGAPPPGAGEGSENDEGGDNAELQNIVSAQVNKAISSHMTRFRQSFERDITGTLQKSLAPITEQLATMQKTPDPKDDDAKAKGSKSIEELKRAESRIADLERKNKEAEERANAMETKRKTAEERGALETALRGAGIEGPRVRAAVALLYGEDQRIGRAAEDESIIFRIQKPGYVHEATLEEGVSEWLQTEEGKTFLPPRGAAGSGATGSPPPRRRGAPNTKEERVNEARRDLMRANGIRVAE